MRPDQLARLAADPNLTPDAVRLVIYVASLGEGKHEIEAHTLRALLRCKGDKPVYNARTEAVQHGYITWGQGGQKHPNWYEYLAFRGEVSKDRDADTPPPGETKPRYVAAGGDVFGPQRVGTSGTVGTGLQQNNNPPPPTPTARADDLNLAAMRKWLGPFAGALDLFDVSAAHSPGWPGMVWGWYRPPGAPPDAGGTQWGDLADLPSLEGRMRALADALTDYSGTGKPLAGDHFRGYVRKAAKNEQQRSKQPRAAASGGGGGGPGGGTGQVPAGTGQGSGGAIIRNGRWTRTDRRDP